MAKKSTPYFVGHKKYGQMGPMTEKEYLDWLNPTELQRVDR